MTDKDRNDSKVNKAHPVRIVLSCVLFVLLCASLLMFAGKLLQPKYYFASELKSPETEMWDNFYALEKNSLTTVFMGDSDVYCGVDAARFNSLTGESSFDMAVSSGSFMEAYYFLQEVLRYQSPRTVVLEMNCVTRDLSKNELMSKRPYQDMRWSKVKWKALTDPNRALSGKELFKRVFTVFEYHDRWRELSDTDLHPEAYRTNVLGYVPCYDIAEDISHDAFYDETETEYNDIATFYFDNIVSLCEQNGIKLILFKTPRIDWNVSYSELADGLAKKYGLEFIDYNYDEKYDRIGIDEETDWRDSAHLNANGAKKFTDALAEDLKKRID